MGELDPQITVEVAEHIKREILTAVPVRIDQLDSENVEALRGKLHVLHYYCLQRRLDPDVTRGIEATLEISKGFWELLEDNSKTLSDLRETHKMRWLDLGSGVLTEFEEIISGEESFRDIIVNSIAILLGWKSDTVWVDMAKKDRRLVPKFHLIRLRDELWRFIGESSQNGGAMTLKKAAEVGEKMDLLLQLVSGDDMPVEVHIVILSQIYALLLKLNISKILAALAAKSRENQGG